MPPPPRQGRRLEPLSVDELLERFADDPLEAVALFSNLFRYPNGPELQRALENDPRFRAPLLRVVAAFKDSDDVRSWMFHRLPKDPDLVPVFVEVWRAWKGDVSHEAELLLRQIGDRRGLEAMAAELGKTTSTFRVGPIEATMKLHVDTAYDRIAVMLEKDPGALWIVFGQVTAEHVAADRRWAELALRSLEDSHRLTRDLARKVLATGVSNEDAVALLATLAPENAPDRATAERALEAHRGTITDLASRLPPDGFEKAKADAERKLVELAEMVGHVPAAVRAFYEQIDSIEIERGKPRDAFVVVPLAEVLDDTRRWFAQEQPGNKPRQLVQRFIWPVTPDGATKSGLSGGEAYGFEAPTVDDDPALNLPRKPTFMKFVTGATRLRKKR